MPSAQYHAPDARPRSSRAFWVGLAFWVLFCAVAVLVRGVRWEEGYERAQVLLGITPYPAGHPHNQWVWNGFSIHYYLTGALLWLTRSAAVVCGSRQFLALVAIHLPVYVLTWLLTRRVLPAHLAVVLSFAGVVTIFQSYMPIAPFATKATSGIIGMGWAFAVIAMLSAGRWRTAGLLFGLMPMIHLGQWPVLLLTTVAVSGWIGWWGHRGALTGLLRWALIGLVCSGSFALAQRIVHVPPAAVGAYHSPLDGHAVWAAYTTHEDMHRALTDWPRFGPWGHSIMALVGFLTLGFPFAWIRVRARTMSPAWLVPYAYGSLCAAAIGFARVVHRWAGTDVPYAVVSWMPYRLTIHVSMLLLCVVCAVACTNRRGQVSWAAFASLGWLFFLPLWPHLLPPLLAGRYFATPETAVFLLAGAALPGIWQETEADFRLRCLWTAMVSAGIVILGWYSQFIVAAVLGGVGIALAERAFARTTPVRRREVLVASLLGIAILAGILLGQWRGRESLPVSPFEAEMASYLADHSAPSDMVLTPLDEHYQMVLNRPVVATFETRQFMAYMPSLAATTATLFAELYGVRDGQWYDWALWMDRTPGEWQALGEAYGFRYVLSKSFHPLHLPERLSGDGLVLYEVPAAGLP